MMKEYYTALLAARQQMGPLVKNAVNPHFRNRYADLSAVMATIEDALLDNGLIVEQFPSVDERMVTLDTVITHAETAQQNVHTIAIPLGKNDAQGVGSAITYARRYALTSIFGLAQEDDDGNAASDRPQRQQPAQRNGHKPAPNMADVDELNPFDDFPYDISQNAHENAVTWGMEQECFKARQHAQNAYKKIVEEVGWTPDNNVPLSTLAAAWVKDVARRVNEKEEKVAA